MDPPSQSDAAAAGGGGGGRPRQAAAAPQRDHPPALPADAAQPVLALDRIRTTGGANEYTEGPTAARRSAASEAEPEPEPEPEPNPPPPPPTQNGDASGSPSGGEGALQPEERGGSAGRRLLQAAVRAQPKQHRSEELKPLGEAGKAEGAHVKCEECGRCRCPECRRPRALPSCWLCGRRCVCSAQSAAEYGTCVCCVKGLFYHCSSDDEDTCADRPFSCAPPRRCARWAAASLLALLFPCVLCYLPAKGCVAACQGCYDRVTRPGCRC